MNIRIDKDSNTPLYKQICAQIREQVLDGQLLPGQILPSLNQLAIILDISRETTKKAYNQLIREKLLITQQGKGVFVAGEREPGLKEILVILDKQSIYKQVLLQAFQETLGGRLKVVVLPQSLYGKEILKSVDEFANDNGIEVCVYDTVPQSLEKGDVVLVLNSQLDSGLALLARRISEAGLEPGRDVRIISYNEFPLNEVVLGGLTTMSTDFPSMGRTAAEMILSGIPSKVHNPFRLVRRSTF
jgi:DNA-binding transcriptional regulator YhcF (GntR family)